MIMNKFAHAFIILMSSLLWLPSTAHSEGLSDLFANSDSSSQTKFLPVDKAFKVSASTTSHKDKATLSVQFDITPGHYVYKDRFKLTLPAGVTASALKFNQSAHFVDDPQFGRVAVFDQPSLLVTAVLSNSGSQAIDKGTLSVGWQGCAKAGLCYPPEKVNTSVSLPAASKATVTKADSGIDVTPKAASKPAPSETNTKAASKVTPQGTNNPPTGNTPAEDANALTGSNSAASTTNPSSASIAAANSSGLVNANDPQSMSESDTSSTEQDPLENSSANPLSTDILAEQQASESVSLAGNAPGLQMPAQAQAVAENSQPLVDQDPFKLATHPWLALGLLFLAGLGLAFTPCVLPMLPIVANIVGNQRNPTPKKSVILTSCYALGVAIAYGLLGALIAVFGQSLGIIGWLQNPIILLAFAAIFVLLGLYMLELLPLRMPALISRKMSALNEAGNSKLGSAGGSLIAGFLSALVVSPCVSAPLFGALLAVSTIGNPLLGFAALFMLGFGLSAPLILLGATQGSFMPKAGEWMNWVKQGFALLLFAVALLLLERVFISTWMLLVWALWFMVVAVWAWQWRQRGRVLTQALGLVAGVWATVLILGSALGNTDSLQPLASLNATANSAANTTGYIANNGVNNRANTANDNGTSATAAVRITTLAELDDITASTPQVLVDVTADWCIECRIMDKALFATPPAQLAGWQVVKLDITDTTAESKAILARYRLFGPPALLYYQSGELVAQQVGEIKRPEFIEMLGRLQQ